MQSCKTQPVGACADVGFGAGGRSRDRSSGPSCCSLDVMNVSSIAFLHPGVDPGADYKNKFFLDMHTYRCGLHQVSSKPITESV